MVAQNIPEVTPWEHLKVVIKGKDGEEINLSQKLNILTFELGRYLAEWILAGLGTEKMNDREALSVGFLECVMKHSMIIQDVIQKTVNQMREDIANGDAVISTEKERAAMERKSKSKSKSKKGKKKGKKKRKDK